MRISEASDLFLRVRTQEGFSPYTINAYRLQHQLLVRDIGDIDVQEITLQILRDHISHHGHLKPTSIGHKIRAIKSLFKWLVEEELLLRNPTLKLNEPKRGKRVPKALTIEELELLRDSCMNALEHALMEFSFASGCRVAEIQRLNRSDIDVRRTSSEREARSEIYFGAKARIWLQRYLGERNDNDRALFVTVRQPHRISIHEIQYIFKRVAKRCKLEERVSSHKLKHAPWKITVTYCAKLMI